nr:MAG TPA: hypothetical protein [Caudoviricetes sp.]
MIPIIPLYSAKINAKKSSSLPVKNWSSCLLFDSMNKPISKKTSVLLLVFCIMKSAFVTIEK